MMMPSVVSSDLPFWEPIALAALDTASRMPIGLSARMGLYDSGTDQKGQPSGRERRKGIRITTTRLPTCCKPDVFAWLEKRVDERRQRGSLGSDDQQAQEHEHDQDGGEPELLANPQKIPEIGQNRQLAHCVIDSEVLDRLLESEAEVAVNRVEIGLYDSEAFGESHDGHPGVHIRKGIVGQSSESALSSQGDHFVKQQSRDTKAPILMEDASFRTVEREAILAIADFESGRLVPHPCDEQHQVVSFKRVDDALLPENGRIEILDDRQ